MLRSVSHQFGEDQHALALAAQLEGQAVWRRRAGAFALGLVHQDVVHPPGERAGLAAEGAGDGGRRHVVEAEQPRQLPGGDVVAEGVDERQFSGMPCVRGPRADIDALEGGVVRERAVGEGQAKSTGGALADGACGDDAGLAQEGEFLVGGEAVREAGTAVHSVAAGANGAAIRRSVGLTPGVYGGRADRFPTDAGLPLDESRFVSDCRQWGRPLFSPGGPCAQRPAHGRERGADGTGRGPAGRHQRVRPVSPPRMGDSHRTKGDAERQDLRGLVSSAGRADRRRSRSRASSPATIGARSATRRRATAVQLAEIDHAARGAGGAASHRSLPHPHLQWPLSRYDVLAARHVDVGAGALGRMAAARAAAGIADGPLVGRGVPVPATHRSMGDAVAARSPARRRARRRAAWLGRPQSSAQRWKY